MRPNEKLNISRDAIFCGDGGRITPIHPSTVAEDQREVHNQYLDFIEWLDRNEPNKIRHVHADNEPEFLSLRTALNR